MPTEPSKADPPKRQRRWFQFSLRSLMVFTVVCAIAAGWLGKKIERKRWAQQSKEATAASDHQRSAVFRAAVRYNAAWSTANLLRVH